MPGKHATGLSTAGFKRHQLAAHEQRHLMNAFGGDGSITEVLGVIGDGKEATVYGCRAGPDTGVERAVAKVYRADHFRAFANAAHYDTAQGVTDRRMQRAIKGKTRRGRLMSHHMWIEREWDTLCRLFDAGADVPEPYTHSSDAILMEWVGDDEGVAPQLRRVRLDPGDARETLDRLLRNVELFLRCDRVHGDLSAYNVLWDGERPCVIDLPQAIDARSHPGARDLLTRDVENVCGHFRRLGVERDARSWTGRLWDRYRRGVL